MQDNGVPTKILFYSTSHRNATFRCKFPKWTFRIGNSVAWLQSHTKKRLSPPQQNRLLCPGSESEKLKYLPFFRQRDDAMNEAFQRASGTMIQVCCRSSCGRSPRHSTSLPSLGPFKSSACRLAQTQSCRSSSWCASHRQRQQYVLSPASANWHNRPSADSPSGCVMQQSRWNRLSRVVIVGLFPWRLKQTPWICQFMSFSHHLQLNWSVGICIKTGIISTFHPHPLPNSIPVKSNSSATILTMCWIIRPRETKEALPGSDFINLW